VADETKTLNIAVDGEQREYDVDTLPEAAIQKVVAMQFDSNTVMPVLSEIIRLVQLGQRVDQGELQTLLPQKGYTVVNNDEIVVESPEEDIKETKKSK